MAPSTSPSVDRLPRSGAFERESSARAARGRRLRRPLDADVIAVGVERDVRAAARCGRGSDRSGRTPWRPAIVVERDGLDARLLSARSAGGDETIGQCQTAPIVRSGRIEQATKQRVRSASRRSPPRAACRSALRRHRHGRAGDRASCPRSGRRGGPASRKGRRRAADQARVEGAAAGLSSSACSRCRRSDLDDLVDLSALSARRACRAAANI